MNTWLVILYTVLGTVASSLLSLLPALHIYNVAGVIIILTMGAGTSTLIPMPYVPIFMMSMVVGWAILNTIPALFLGAPDESAIFVVLPGQKYMMQGRGYEAAALTGLGALAGIVLLAAAVNLAIADVVLLLMGETTVIPAVAAAAALCLALCIEGGESR